MADSEIMTLLVRFYIHSFRVIRLAYIGYVFQNMPIDFFANDLLSPICREISTSVFAPILAFTDLTIMLVRTFRKRLAEHLANSQKPLC